MIGYEGKSYLTFVLVFKLLPGLLPGIELISLKILIFIDEVGPSF